MAKACANKLQLAALAQACWTVGRRFRRIVKCRGYARSWSRPVVLDGFRYAVGPAHSFVSGYVTAGRLLRLRAGGQWREEGREKRFLGFTASPIGKPGPNMIRRSALYRIPHFAVVATRPTL